MRAVKSVSIDSERRVIITFLDGSTETLYPNCIWCDSEALRQLIKDLLEEKADAIVQTVENVTIATFADGADEALIRKLLVSIDPIQEGTGDPSPENVRPISGRTGCYISTSRSVYPLLQGAIAFNTGTDVTDLTRIKTDYIPYSGDSSLSFYCKNSKSTDRVRRIFWYNALKEFISSSSLSVPDPSTPFEYTNFTPPENAGYYRLVIQALSGTQNISPDGRVIVVNPIITSVNWQTEVGVVYGGTLDIVSGKLKVDRAYIASYNGEVLPSTWISDRDVYAEGTTPTIGAQVVYKIEHLVEYQLTPQNVKTLLGENNIWADSGNILELEYVADTKLYIGESQSDTLGSGRQTISNTDLRPASEKTLEDISEAYKAETAEKETKDERGE